MSDGDAPFLRVPPFPRSRARPISVISRDVAADGTVSRALMQMLAQARVGGAFWAPSPLLPEGRDLVLAPRDRSQAEAMVREAGAAGADDRILLVGCWRGLERYPAIPRHTDPWHVAETASSVWVDAGDELALVAALAGRSVRPWGEGRFRQLEEGEPGLVACVARELNRGALQSPYDGSPIDAEAAIAMLAGWRALFERNRTIDAVFGIAAWKRETLDALLWDGAGGPRYLPDRAADTIDANGRVLAWVAKVAPDLPERLAARGIIIGEIEDGMIRSSGLGADCVPPLSAIVDMAGAHFDPSVQSGIERLLQCHDYDERDLQRARALRERLVAAGIGKYGRDTANAARPRDPRRRVLVTGQVEDDRSMLRGGAGCTNAELVRRARQIEPDAYLIYKPHPDVEAGHRKGHIPDAEILAYADQVDRRSSIQSLFDIVDGVHVITSLAGFEALLRAKDVTTHGVPFYAGWGLTRDLGPVPARRTRRRSLDELVAATLIHYPLYLDPVTGLPCPVEVLVDRLANDTAQRGSPLVALRRMQGRIKRVAARVLGGNA